MKQEYAEIQRLSAPYLDTRGNDLHTRVATEFAYRLLQTEEGDEDVAIPAILLHDVGWKKVPEDLQHKAYGPKMTRPDLKRLHETEGAKTARTILEKVGHDPEKTKRIVEIIDGHDTRKEALSPEDAIVKDSDKLWRCSKQGFYIGIKKFGETPQQGIDRLSAAVDSWFFTDTAKKIAKDELAARIEEVKEGGPYQSP